DFLDDGDILAVLTDFCAADRKIIDVLGPARRLRCKSQAFLVAQDVDGSRFAGVGTAGESDFGHGRVGQITQVVDGGKEAGLPEFGHGTGEKCEEGAKTPESYCTIGSCVLLRRGRIAWRCTAVSRVVVQAWQSSGVNQVCRQVS